MRVSRRGAAAALVVLALLLLGLAGRVLLGGDGAPIAAAPPSPAVAVAELSAATRGAAADSPPTEVPSSPIPVAVPASTPAPPAPEAAAPAASVSKAAPARDQSVVARVVDSTTGLPIAGARVLVETTGGGDEKFEGATDSQGRIRIDGLPRSRMLYLRVEAHGFVRMGDLRFPPWEFDVQLSPASRLFGKVLDPAGKPVAGAKVFVDGIDGQRMLARFAGSAQAQFQHAQSTDSFGVGDDTHEPLALFRPQAVTDAAGRFEAEAIPVARSLDVFATANGFSPSETRRGVVVPVGSAGEEITLVVRPDTTLVLRPTSPDGASPSESVRATVATLLGPRRLRRRDDGAWTLSGLTGGKTWYLVEAAPYAAVFDSVDVEIGRATEVEVPLGSAAGISGQVVDAEGRGVAGLRIGVTRDRTGAWELKLDGGAETDAAGRFEIRGLQDGPYFVAVEDVRAGFRMEHGSHAAPTTGLRLPAPGSLRCRLLPPSGRELPEIRDLDIGHAAENQKRLESVSNRSNLEYERETGAVRVPITYPGKMTLAVKAPGCQELRRTVQVPSGGEVDIGEVALLTSFRATGRVRDPSGKPVPDAEVEAWYRNGVHCSARTDIAGAFELLDLAAGEVTVEVHDAAGAEAKFALRTWTWNFQEGMPPLDLEVVPGGAVRVRVLDPDGSPVTVSHVACEPGKRSRYRPVPRALAPTGNPGEYAGRRQPGAMQITVLDPVRPQFSDVLASAKVEIREGAETFVEIRIPKKPK